PVLKLIESPYPRLLISDEVGLGKTIEAGIILTELNARMNLNRVLIVCPSSLMTKWRSELRERFDLEFEIYDGPTFRDELEELGRLGDSAPIRGIASLELLRRAENIEALNKTKPRLDLVIVDEAHHMRNSGTMSNVLGDYMSSLSEAMVFLTATPLNLGERDFFELLHLLVPEEFNDFESFYRLLEPNEPINESLRILRRQWPPDFAAAAEALRRVEETSQACRYSQNVNYREALRRLDQAAQGEVDREFSVETQRVISRLNSLSHIFTRTKKREVQEHFPTRSAYKIEVEFSPEERRFYDAVSRWAAELYEETGMPVGFVTANYQRQVASCIMAMGTKLERTLATSIANIEDEELTDLDPSIAEPGVGPFSRVVTGPYGADEDSGMTHIETDLGEANQTDSATEVARSWDVVKRAGIDTKFDLFATQLREVFAADPDAKVLVFSFFIGTIDYLEEKLKAVEISGLPVGVRKIYGPIKREDRYQAINDFRTSSGPQVLLTSEVGAEGLDFQFCSTMVNYDLPWNPMRVEQRIGRLDRYGQKSELIEIFNLVIGDSIEDRIFYRLYDRIQIFERSVGDLEAILGNAIGEIQRQVLTGKLTEDQQVERANQVANAIINLQKEHDEFDEQSKKFVGVDEVFTDRFNDIRQGERYISPEELKDFVDRYLRVKFPGVKLRQLGHTEGDTAPAFELIGSEQPQFVSFLNDAYLAGKNLSREHRSLLVRLEKGERCILTFDGRRAMIDRTLEFFSIHHPIVRAMVLSSAGDAETFPCTGHLVIPLGAAELESAEPGSWLFFLFEISIRGLRDEIALVAAVMSPEGEVDDGLSDRFLTLAKLGGVVDGL
ncbi:MAG: DEAD/DEAH box helicase, partial [Caldilineaceae bacterium]|nr:DEAD/DEAH box helicase [Caldilineaceae bacterium]